jgi:large subunit ribosomal protein L15
MDLKGLKAVAGKHKKRKRRGRGQGSGLGKTSGRGEKGQGSRSGSSRRVAFEGGQMPLARRVPKRGFNNTVFATHYCEINVRQLNIFDDGERINLESLQAKGLARKPLDGIKILGDGELTRKLTVEAHAFTAGAKTKIEGAGGEVVLLEGKLRPRRKAAGPIPAEIE